jgi:hypothetical protein
MMISTGRGPVLSPWHKLPLSETTMATFAFNDDLSWGVSKRAICVIGADGTFQPVEGKMATVREDTDKVLGIVGED